jgi:hypothetical protein
MLDLPDQPFLDKDYLVGGCVRLPLRIDTGRLLDECRALPETLWGSRGGRVGVHEQAEAIFLRGYAPAEGERPIEDRPAMASMPYVGELITKILGGGAMRCLLARLAPGGVVALHVDRPPYFSKTLRLHLPVETNDRAVMYCRGRRYRMAAGEVWALNNSNVHGVWNGDASHARTHLICDFLPSPTLLRLLADGERNLGSHDPELERLLARQVPAAR